MRYFFHLREDGGRLLDPHGIECATDSDARSKAIEEAHAIIAADARDGCIDLRQWIEIEDEDGRSIDQVQFESVVTLIRGSGY